MDEQVIHIKTPISREDLDCVVAGLEAACGGKRIMVTDTFELTVEDERQAVALKALFNPNGNIENTSIKHAGGRPKKVSKEIAPEKKHRKQILYTILDGPETGRKIRGPNLHLMLKAGNLAAGIRLSHPERGLLTVVTNGAGIFTLQAVPA
ncbi:MAG: hypothetical protein ABSG01_09075 [Anaerolineales bacterium]|jgi:hypothetical protein